MIGGTNRVSFVVGAGKSMDLNLTEVLIGAILGAIASWYISAHFHRKSLIGTREVFSAERVVSLDIDEAWRRLVAPDRFGYVAWTSPNLPPGTEIVQGLEIDRSPADKGGMYVVDVKPPERLRFGPERDEWDTAIRFVERPDGLHVYYTRLLPYTGRGSDASSKGIVENDIERLMHVLGDRS